MKKFVSLLLTLMMALGMTALAEESKDQLARIQEKGEIVIATEGTWAPWTYTDENGTLVGFDVEIATAIAEKLGVKAIFQGGEKNSVADVFFHGYANYEKGVGQNYLKLTSCNTTGLIRTVDCLDREIGIEKVAITIIRRVADPGDYHRGLTNALQMEKAPTHQAVDLMTIMPHVNATGILVHTPVTHGHIITVLATAKDGKKITKEMALAAFQKHPRIRVVSIDEGFKGNASFFKYARDLGNRRGDMYEIGLWEDSIVESGNDIMYAINIPQESVTIPETMDAIRAATGMQLTREEGTAMTNKYLGIGKFKTLG